MTEWWRKEEASAQPLKFLGIVQGRSTAPNFSLRGLSLTYAHPERRISGPLNAYHACLDMLTLSAEEGTWRSDLSASAEVRPTAFPSSLQIVVNFASQLRVPSTAYAFVGLLSVRRPGRPFGWSASNIDGAGLFIITPRAHPSSPAIGLQAPSWSSDSSNSPFCAKKSLKVLDRISRRRRSSHLSKGVDESTLVPCGNPQAAAPPRTTLRGPAEPKATTGPLTGAQR